MPALAVGAVGVPVRAEFAEKAYPVKSTEDVL